MKKIKFTMVLALLGSVVLGQMNVTRTSFLDAGFLQVKEGNNFGLVFKGPGLDFGMNWEGGNDHGMIGYGFETGIGILFTRKIPALSFYLKPIDLTYLYRFPLHKGDLYLGPSLVMEYSYQLYPDLQAGFDYWMTNLSMGASLRYLFPVRNSSFQFRIHSSLAGLVSRQQENRNPYFYDIGINHAFVHLHEDLDFSWAGKSQSIRLELLCSPSPESRVTLGYVLHYQGYPGSPEYKYLVNGIRILIRKKQ